MMFSFCLLTQLSYRLPLKWKGHDAVLHWMPLDQLLMNLLPCVNVPLPVMGSCSEGKKSMLGVAKPSAEGLGTLVASWSSWSCGCSAAGRKSVPRSVSCTVKCCRRCRQKKKRWINTEYISMSSVWAVCRGSVPGCLSQISSPGWVSLTWSGTCSFLCKLGSWKRTEPVN